MQDKRLPWKQGIPALCILGLGLILLLAGSFGSFGEGEDTETGGQDLTRTDYAQIQAYVHTLENDLQSLLLSMDGVTDPRVMITLDTAGETELASISTASSPVTLTERFPQIRGVVVTTPGAADPTVKKRIFEVICAVLDVPSHRVCVTP